jgi:hypothetical protein
MDLAALLDCDAAGHPTLAAWYGVVFQAMPMDYPGAFRVRAALNFGVQQLATRSRMARGQERYLQLGNFSPHDLPAAVAHAMPHTNVAWLASADGDETAALLAALRGRLCRDDMPEDIFRIDAWPVAPERFGLIAVFAEGAAPDLAPLRPLLTSAGRILLIRRPDARTAPVMTLHD